MQHGVSQRCHNIFNAYTEGSENFVVNTGFRSPVFLKFIKPKNLFFGVGVPILETVFSRTLCNVKVDKSFFFCFFPHS